jgi:hypothetical protein
MLNLFQVVQNNIGMQVRQLLLLLSHEHVEPKQNNLFQQIG